MTQLYIDLLNGFVPSLLVVGLAWVAMRLLRLNAATRYASWWIVIAIVAIMPFLAHEFRKNSRHASEPLVYVQPEVPTAPAISKTTPVAAAPAAPAPVVDESINPVDLVLPVYLIVALLLSVRLIVDYRRIRLMLRGAQAVVDYPELPLQTRRQVRVLFSDRVETPMVAGFWRPAIVIPAALAGKLTDADWRHVMIHELAHIARWDDWTNLFARILQILFWPHPLIAFALRRIEIEREHACDDWAVNAAGGSATSYAKALTRLVEVALANRQPLLAATVVGQGAKVSQRVERILTRTRNLAPRISLVKLAMSLVCVGLFALICAQAPAMIAISKAEHVEEEEPFFKPVAIEAEEPQPETPAEPAAEPVATAPVGPIAPPPPIDPKLGFLAALSAAGYRDLSVDEIIDLKNRGIDANFIRNMSSIGWGKLTPAQLISLHDHGVSADYLRDLRAAGIRNLSLDQVRSLKDHGVSARAFHEIHSLGFGPYDAGEAIDMSQHGIRPDFFRGLKEHGITQMSARHTIEAARNGLSPKSLDEARRYGPNLSFEQILKLKRAGVI